MFWLAISKGRQKSIQILQIWKHREKKTKKAKGHKIKRRPAVPRDPSLLSLLEKLLAEVIVVAERDRSEKFEIDTKAHTNVHTESGIDVTHTPRS